MCSTVWCVLKVHLCIRRAGEHRDDWFVLGNLVCIRQVASMACIRRKLWAYYRFGVLCMGVVCVYERLWSVSTAGCVSVEAPVF